ncbi:hypothetical protein [Cupriavidus pauculus]|uniref:hypothetical protein n=1 Tax=Cupriavidus pauculus TaxID=82633 RepID=UPI0011AFA533|nr:hypothetical protein [Cupriavidus pauculus]
MAPMQRKPPEIVLWQDLAGFLPLCFANRHITFREQDVSDGALYETGRKLPQILWNAQFPPRFSGVPPSIPLRDFSASRPDAPLAFNFRLRHASFWRMHAPQPPHPANLLPFCRVPQSPLACGAP